VSLIKITKMRKKIQTVKTDEEYPVITKEDVVFAQLKDLSIPDGPYDSGLQLRFHSDDPKAPNPLIMTINAPQKKDDAQSKMTPEELAAKLKDMKIREAEKEIELLRLKQEKLSP